MWRGRWTDGVVLANVEGPAFSNLSTIERNVDIELVFRIFGHGMLHSLPAIYSIMAFCAFICRVVSINVISLIHLLCLVAL